MDYHLWLSVGFEIRRIAGLKCFQFKRINSRKKSEKTKQNNKKAKEEESEDKKSKKKKIVKRRMTKY